MHLRSRRPLVFLLTTILLITSAIFEWHSAIRFMYSPLNPLAAALLALSIPISIIFLGRALVRFLWKFLAFATGAVLLIPMLIVAALALLLADDLKLENSLAVGSATYRVYLHESASPMSVPVAVLRKERDTVFGVKLVRTIWKDDYGGQTRLRLVNDSTLEVVVDGVTRTKLDI